MLASTEAAQNRGSVQPVNSQPVCGSVRVMFWLASFQLPFRSLCTSSASLLVEWRNRGRGNFSIHTHTHVNKREMVTWKRALAHVSFSFTYPLTAGVVWDHRWLHNQFPPFFSVFHCPLGLSELQACLFLDFVFPPLFLSALSSSPFHCILQDGFVQIWWTGNMSIPLQFPSLYDGRELFVWSDCLLDFGTDLVTWSLNELRISLR